MGLIGGFSMYVVFVFVKWIGIVMFVNGNVLIEECVKVVYWIFGLFGDVW